MSYLAKTTSKGHDYYKIMESYRVNGRTKHRTLLNIGPLPNLFALLPDSVKKGEVSSASDYKDAAMAADISVDPIRCRCHGAPYLLFSVAEWLGVEEIMSSIFKPGTDHGVSRSRSLLLGAIHRACQPGSKKAFADWFRYTSLPDYTAIDPDVMTSQHFWEQMDDIDTREIKRFETELFIKILAQFPEVKDNIKCLSSDFTNYYTFINTQNYRCEIAQLGHSKEGRTGQKIFSVAVVTTPLLGVPIATLVYPGNLNDKTALKLFMDELRSRLSGIIDLSEVTFVFDGGGVSEEVLDMIPGHFITRGLLKSSQELYSVPLDSYESFTLDNKKVVRAYRAQTLQYGKLRTSVVTLSDDLRAGQEAELKKQLARFQDEIDKLNQSLQNQRATKDKRLPAISSRVSQLMLPSFHFSDFIDVSYDTVKATDPIILRAYKKAVREYKKAGSKEPFSCEIEGLSIHTAEDIPVIDIVSEIKCLVNETKKTAMIDKYYGKHLLITDQEDWSTEKILNVYRDQEFIERFFRDSKDTSHFSVRPAFHWTDDKIRVHVMMCYLGLTLCRVAQYMLRKEYGIKRDSSDLLEQLEKVQECLVIVNVGKEKLKPIKSISELDDKIGVAWNAVSKFLQYMKDHPTEQVS